MRRTFVAIVALSLTAVALGIVGAGPAVANNDPHRVFLPGAPLDLPAGRSLELPSKAVEEIVRTAKSC